MVTGWLAVARVVSRLGLALLVILTGYLFIYRPEQLRWGVTDAEVTRAMPGDQIQPQPIFNATLAVIINARPLCFMRFLHPLMGQDVGSPIPHLVVPISICDRPFQYAV